MVCARFTYLFLGLLLSWLALCESTSIAQIETATRIRENQNKLDLKLQDLHFRTETVRKMKLITGRKMRVVSGVKQRVESSKIKKNEEMRGKEVELEEFSSTEELKEAEKAIHSMMNRDYNLRAKAKPPIHNNEPFDEVDEEP